jgi:hypothetical protein
MIASKKAAQVTVTASGSPARSTERMAPAGRSSVCTLLVAAVAVVPAVVPEGAAADGVDDDDEDEEDDVDDGDALPVRLQRGHNAGLARVAAVAERGSVVAPGAAVRVRRVVRGARPLRAVDEAEAAAGRGLAAAGLRTHGETVSLGWLLEQKIMINQFYQCKK